MKRGRHNDTFIARNRRRLCRILIPVISLAGVSSAQSIHRATIDTLAVIAKKVITSAEFARLYKEKLVRLGLTDNGETRNGYLRNLVDDEVLIAQAKNKKLDRTKEARAALTRIQLQELLNAYLAKHISSHIEVTDNDLKELFLKMNTRIKVRHLYAQTKEKADSLYAELTKGESFDELAKFTFSDPRLRETGGSLGYISFDEMDPDFERTAYQMKVGEISKPVKTVQGYSIIKVDDIKSSPFVTENEFLKAKEKLKGFARKRKFEQAVKHYTAALRNKLNIQFNYALLSRLYDMTQQGSFQYVIENKSLVLSREDLKKTVVTTTRERWNVSSVINALSKTTEVQRKWIHTKENFEDFIAGLVMRKYMSQRAKEEKLDAAPSLRENVEYAFDTYLLITLEDQLRKQITISQDSIISYYVQNKDKFRTQPEIRLSAILVDNAAPADSIKRSLEQGAPFDELAKKFSIQRLTAEYGGDLGFYRKEELGSLGTDLFASKVGQWSGPFAEDGKYLFLKCTNRKDSIYKSFEESSKEIEDMLVSMAWHNARSQYVETFKKRINCYIYPERLMANSFINR